MERIYGKHSIRAVLRQRPEDAIRLLILSEKYAPDPEFITLGEKCCVRTDILRLKEFTRVAGLSGADKHQGVFLFARPTKIHRQEDLKNLAKARVILMLDQVSNPENLGTMIRSAAFFGIDAIIWFTAVQLTTLERCTRH